MSPLGDKGEYTPPRFFPLHVLPPDIPRDALIPPSSSFFCPLCAALSLSNARGCGKVMMSAAPQGLTTCLACHGRSGKGV